MIKTHRPTAEIRADMEAAKARLSEIGARIAAIKTEGAALERERDALSSPWGRNGKIERLARELAESEIVEADAILPRLRISANGSDAGEVVVSRVTKKRIYTRRPGDTYEAIWTHAGLPEARWSSARLLDLDKIADLIAKAGGAK